MDKQLFDEAKKLQEKIDSLTTRHKQLQSAIDRGLSHGCGAKATVTYTPGSCSSERAVLIFDKEVIKQALICEFDIVGRTLGLLEEEFKNL